MRNLILISFLLLTVYACDESSGKSFYMTNNGEEVTQIYCPMTDVKIRVDFSTLGGYAGGDLLVCFEMMSEKTEVIGEGTGELYVSATDIPEDNMLWIDANPATSPVRNYETQKPFNIFYFCGDEFDVSQSKIRITYYEPSVSGENKVGYEDGIVVLNI